MNFFGGFYDCFFSLVTFLVVSYSIFPFIFSSVCPLISPMKTSKNRKTPKAKANKRKKNSGKIAGKN
jgi:hypothetical protein